MDIVENVVTIELCGQKSAFVKTSRFEGTKLTKDSPLQRQTICYLQGSSHGIHARKGVYPSPFVVRIVGSLCPSASVYSAPKSNYIDVYSPRLNKTTSSLYAPPSCPPTMKRQLPTCVEVCESRRCERGRLRRVQMRVSVSKTSLTVRI